ncbi:hypothetical protein EVAR_82442_1 [Eumeta japonica]|uniref:Uncharacterized protein n=1 Tax=Eumeta variegata TaxID=151549 RepID=A0A4C1YJ68_EUMVA|nr:hypothetical protein EVAR_82442_1 [Eumeta japonica]
MAKGKEKTTKRWDDDIRQVAGKTWSRVAREESQNERTSRLNPIHERLVCESTEERDNRLDVIRHRLTNETPGQRQHRLDIINQRIEQNFLFNVRKDWQL